MAEIAHQLGGKALAEVAVAAKPDTILCWFRKLVARKFDGSACRQLVGRPRIEKTIEDLIVHMAQENFVVGLRSHGGGAGQSWT